MCREIFAICLGPRSLSVGVALLVAMPPQIEKGTYKEPKESQCSEVGSLVSEDGSNGVDDRTKSEYESHRADGDTECVVFPCAGHAFPRILGSLQHCGEYTAASISDIEI